ncbi:ABC transporter ATP-binding protein [Brevibacillus invocatus]|uniref:ABC transporter ATP-binding protein n=1 Tax=Brevibacillus invocatus TaxID=173959 RepID=A0A3M8BYW9_9BACL|nr:ABC transporter ATP-binding protein [Brevibacillus invocatus]RNB68519.1 ABC transporter ATP-binding protein [Brevibacillus invocatus]
MTEFGLVMKQVEKKIDKKQIVHPFDLRIEPGEVIALCGGNGAGKSTILRMIVGILRPTSGTIELNGLNWKEQRVEYLEQIGYMPDHFQFAAGLTANETLSFYASLRGVPQVKVDEALRAVGLQDAKNKRVTQFSKGMQQRLLFAQAIIANPALVVLDEPTNGLDPYWMDAFVDLVKGLKDAGQSVIFSTHQLQVADAASDRAIFLMNGQIVQSGTIDDYKTRYGALGLHGAFSDLFTRPVPEPPSPGTSKPGKPIVTIKGRKDNQ